MANIENFLKLVNEIALEPELDDDEDLFYSPNTTQIIDFDNVWKALSEIRKHTQNGGIIDHHSYVYIPAEIIWGDVEADKTWSVELKNINQLEADIKQFFKEDNKQELMDFLNYKKSLPALEDMIEKWEKLKGFW